MKLICYTKDVTDELREDIGKIDPLFIEMDRQSGTTVFYLEGEISLEDIDLDKIEGPGRRGDERKAQEKD